MCGIDVANYNNIINYESNDISFNDVSIIYNLSINFIIDNMLDKLNTSSPNSNIITISLRKFCCNIYKINW